MANLGVQNKNPGNLKDPTTGNFRVFSTPEEGHQALLNDIKIKQSGQSPHIKPGASLSDFANVWAPSSDKNNPTNYANILSEYLGVPTAYAFDKIPAEKLAEGIKVAEGTSSLNSSQNSSVSIFAKKVKAKYPQYNDMSDEELTQKILAKYPQYSDMVNSSEINEPAKNEQGYITTGYQPPNTQEQQTTPGEPGFGKQMSDRLQQASGAITKTATGEINPVSGILQTAGAAGGAINDVTGNILNAIPGVKQITGLIGKGVNTLAQTEPGQALVGAYQNFSQEHPELSADINAVGNIAGAVGTISGAGALKKMATEGISKALGKDVLESVIKDVTPEFSASTAAKQIIKKGTQKAPITGKISLGSDMNIRNIAETVAENVPKFEKLGTFSEKINATKEAISNLAEKLKTNLINQEVKPILTMEDLQTLEKSMKSEILKNPLLVGDAGKQAQRIFNQFKEFLPKGRDIFMEDVLDARKALDNWISEIKGPTVFDPKTENAVSVGLRAVRQGANDIMESRVPDAGVKVLLKKQSQLYKALDNMAPKAVKELGSGKLSRFIKRHPLATGLLKNTAKVTAAGAGLGLVGRGVESLFGEK